MGGRGTLKKPTNPPRAFTPAPSPPSPSPRSPPSLTKPNTEVGSRLCCLTNKFKPVAPSPQPYTLTQAYTQHSYVVQGKPLRTINAGEETTASLGAETNSTKMFSNATHVDSVCSTFVNKGFTTESTNRRQEHWGVKLRVGLLYNCC